MRVVHVHRLRGIGGSERHLLVLLPALARLGLEPMLLGLDDPGGDPEPVYGSLEAAGVPTFRLPCPSDVDPALLRRVVRSLRGLRPDLVHTHLVHADLYGGLAAVRTRTPLVSTKHNDDRFRTGPFRHVERALAVAARRVIAISHALARFSVDEVGLPAAKVRVVHYGLDELPSAWADDEPAAVVGGDRRVLLAIGRLTEQKGLENAVAAMPAIRGEHPEAVLVVLGDGPARARLAEQARALGVDDAVVLRGRSGDVAAWLRRADVFVHPARWEGFGLVVLEAMLAGLPVVASRVSALPELVADEETGLLVPPDDPGSLAAAVSRLLADPDTARQFGEAGHGRARTEFSVARMAERTHAVYGEAV